MLVTGPTGSGKSTTLYAALNSLNTPDKNIITIEDPVEYQLEGVTQIAVNARSGLTFASGLRSMMRADPDIIMVGEIRDRETAQISIEAALTGHLVLSTLHTNSAPGSITRLMEMGIESFLVASSVRCVVAQRLARLLCTGCKRRVMLEASVLAQAGFPVDLRHRGLRGGRLSPAAAAAATAAGSAIYEIMPISDAIRDLALHSASADQISATALAEGMRDASRRRLDKVRLGVTAIDEVLRVLGT